MDIQKLVFNKSILNLQKIEYIYIYLYIFIQYISTHVGI